MRFFPSLAATLNQLLTVDGFYVGALQAGTVGYGSGLTQAAVDRRLIATTAKPPQLDKFYSVAEAPVRAAEFSELDWTENMVWKDVKREA